MNNLKHDKYSIKIILIVFGIFFIANPLLAAEGGLYLPNPIKCPDLLCVIKDVIRIALGVLGVFATFMFVWGGFSWILSGGNADMIKRGKDTLLYATIGIVVVILSWIFIRFVLEAVAEGTVG
ncbi:hypothetical protein ACFL04_00095 [Patescibacteria group bacterium]